MATKKEKRLFFEALKKYGKICVAIKLEGEGGGGKDLGAGPLKKDRYFFAASLKYR